MTVYGQLEVLCISLYLQLILIPFWLPDLVQLQIRILVFWYCIVSSSLRLVTASSISPSGMTVGKSNSYKLLLQTCSSLYFNICNLKVNKCVQLGVTHYNVCTNTTLRFSLYLASSGSMFTCSLLFKYSITYARNTFLSNHLYAYKNHLH